MDTVVVVGASLAGHSTAWALRSGGYDGRLLVVGDEDVPPYDRPPLSKGFLAGELQPADLALGDPADDLDVQWRLGVGATGLDVERRVVSLSDGSEVSGDAVVLATGARARRLEEVMTPPAPASERVHVLRTLQDAEALRRALRAGERLVVLGGGFIGCEVAATARQLGLSVDVVEMAPTPLSAALGPDIGALVRELHAEHGVHWHCGRRAVRLDAGSQPAARQLSVVLDDDTTLPADVVLVALGSVPRTEWLQESGLQLREGVLCDEVGRAAPGVWAVGDCSAWWHHAEEQHRRVEHWTDAWERARVVARDLLGREQQAPRSAPYVWSDQYDTRLQLAGRRTPGATLELEPGPGGGARGLLAVWRHGGEPVAVLGIDRARDVARWRRRLAPSSIPAPDVPVPPPSREENQP